MPLSSMPSRLPLPVEEVHVHRVDLDHPPVDPAVLRALLSGEERQRAARFRFERDRSRYIVGRGMLRRLLARYTGLVPERVPIGYGAFEKPALGCAGPWFNLSHSGSLALYAFSAAAEIGIDVELDAADLSRERIAERFFSPGEVASLRALPVPLQPRAFLTCWTRKEAFVKARGDGLSLPLDSFDVSLAPGEPPALLRTAWSAHEPLEWQVADISGPGFVAAVTQRATGWRVRELQPSETIMGAQPGQEDQ